MKEILNVAFIGLGQRGKALLCDVVTPMNDINIIGLCDLYEDRVQECFGVVKEKKGNEPFKTNNYKEILELENIDAVIISAAWEAHINITIEAMKKGIIVGSEVGGAYSIDDCWRLVHAYEETKTPVMMLENCCYGRRELMVLNMIKTGILGDIVHMKGGYRHDLRDEIADGEKNRHYRLNNYIHRNCENYPTHEIGPISKALNINNGNRMLTLVSMSSKSAGLSAYINDKRPESNHKETVFNQGDIVTTMIKCANGETITIDLDTTLPRAYSRGFEAHGTKGVYLEDNDSLFLDSDMSTEDHFKWKEHWGNAEKYQEKYDHPLWQEYTKGEVNKGHGGIDWLVLRAFFESVKRGTYMPIDVYDMALWMSITPLSEMSISMGSMPVAIPDFTNGKWCDRKEFEDNKYSLEKVCEDTSVSIF